ncbi:MAG: bifunctional GTP diphosphokinase/guanosine-3',5'-bis pyrophosphate 3'-pyrophosphohydrolase [Chromatiales bacterium]|jgi:GTP pyrophosphokinase
MQTPVPEVPPPADRADKPRFLVSDLCSYLEGYLPPDQVREVYRAYLFGAEAHEGQKRLTGEPYIYHPIAVARILAEMRMDYKCLMAAVLHDVIEDTPTAKAQLAEVFDAEIAELVDGVSKLTQIDFKSHAEAQAANFQKMMLAMARDVRVIMIKLADRLHNMRTLGVMRPEKARRIAKETLEIYAPVAQRLGINSVRLELEELGFAAHWPWRYHLLKEAIARVRGHRKEVVGNIDRAIRERLREEGLDGEIQGREKHLFSLYRKMREKRLSFNEVVDFYGFRIVVDRVDTCYRVLGVMHNLYKPVPGRFKDYIAIPKANGYQSLHTVLFGPHGLPIEIQIRTREMHQIAEAGIAAHWLYKAAGDQVGPAHARASDWLANLLEIQKGAGDSMEFLEHVKIDLYPDEVYVFTPRGKIMDLPKGATVIDFAYAVHSELGNACVAARVDRRLAPLRSRLYNGQTVEIITAPGATPHPSWLNFVVTGKARANIRAYLKNLKHQDAVDLGRRLLDKELDELGMRADDLEPELIRTVLDGFGLAGLDDLLVEVGLGNRPAVLVARRLAGEDQGGEARRPIDRAPAPLAVKGTEGLVVRFGKCCRPIPGDAIVGTFHRGRGLVVHRQGCPNLGEYPRQGESWLDVHWEEEAGAEFSTAIRVSVGNQRGVLATVAAAIAEMGSNIEHVAIGERDGLSSTLDFVINVRDRKHLAAIMRRLRALPRVMRIARAMG